MIDANLSITDSGGGPSGERFPCGTLSGAVTAKLVCDRVFPDLNWDVVPGSGLILIHAFLVPEPGEAEAGVGFQILTPPKMSALDETCATLPPPISGALKASFTGSFTPSLTFRPWLASCNGATQVLPGSSFELRIQTVGTLTHDALGADPLDAGADAFDWGTLNQEVLSNTFHGTFKSTLVGPDGGAPIHVDMTF
jgi:hypothetical protein